MKRLINCLFLFFPLLKFKVLEKSMEPAIKEGSLLLVNKLSYLIKDPKAGDIIVSKNPKKNEKQKFLIKRIREVQNKFFFVVGDNEKESIDSRNFGWIGRNDIIGKVILVWS